MVLYLKIDDKTFVIGTLSKDNIPQISFDVVLEKKFELSHNSKSATVFFIGYKAEIPDEEYPLPFITLFILKSLNLY